MRKHTRRRFGQSLIAGASYAACAWNGLSAATKDQEIEVFPEDVIGVIRPELHSQFAEHLGSCVYGGLWVGPQSSIPNINGYRKSAVEALRTLGVPVLRWPGGCFADSYQWRDGIGPVSQRPRTVNSSWGHVIEDNNFGTHEFLGLCQLIGAQPYLAGNIGSGSPRDLRDWMEYCNFPGDSSLAADRTRNGAPKPFDVKFWGVGNESWGCGGNLAGGEYAEEFRRFQTFLSKFGETAPFLIACGPDRDNQLWTESFLTGLHGKRPPDGYAMHFYSNSKALSTSFTVDDMLQQFATIPKLEEAILHQRRLIDQFDPARKIGLMVDEWGVWDRMNPEDEKAHGLLWQQITMRAAVTTALALNVFHRQADKLVMCNVAQIMNVLDAMLLSDGAACVRTPAYYAFLLAKPHRGKSSLKTTPPQANPTELSVSASRRENAFVVTIVNPGVDASVRVRCALPGQSFQNASARSLFHPNLNAYNSFANPGTVVPQSTTVSIRRDSFTLTVPPLSISTIEAT